jgi:hypothetical protein
MNIPKVVKYSVLTGRAACFVSTVMLEPWPSVLNFTRIPLYAAQIGAWCVFVAICYLAFEFVRAGLRRSKR